MYTVMLLDDEPWALESLFRIFSWQENGYRVIGRYQNPFEGWKAICEQKPDAVIVDVRMPELSGLDIVKKASEMIIPPVFVMVSGYDDFEYAQTALHLGVIGYYLKPIVRSDAAEIIQKLNFALKKRKRERDLAIIELLEDRMDSDDLLRLFEKKTGDYWCVAELMHFSISVESQLEDSLRELNAFAVSKTKTKTIILVNGNKEIDIQLVSLLQQTYPHDDVSVGVSTVLKNPNELTRILKEAHLGCLNHLFGNPVAYNLFCNTDSLEIENVFNSLNDAMYRGDYLLWNSAQKEFESMLNNGKIQIQNLCRYWNKLYYTFLEVYSSNESRDFDTVMDSDDLMSRFSNQYEMLKKMNAMMYIRSAMPEKAEISKTPQFVTEIVEYVRLHFMDKIHLSDLALKFHVNMTYCSEIFHKSTGYTFTEYVNQLRMEYAKQCILKGNCNLQSLALQLGYSDYVAFSKCFKRYHGFSPSSLKSSNHQS